MRRFHRFIYILVFIGFVVGLGVRDWLKLPPAQQTPKNLWEHQPWLFIGVGVFVLVREVLRFSRSQPFARGGLRQRHDYDVELNSDAKLTLAPVMVAGRFLISVTCEQAGSVSAVDPFGKEVAFTQSHIQGTGLSNTFEMWGEASSPAEYTVRLSVRYDVTRSHLPETQNVNVTLQVMGRCEVIQVPEQAVVEAVTGGFPVLPASRLE